MTTMRITVDVEVTSQVAAQMKRAGFEVCKEGRKLLVKVPNQHVAAESTRVQFEELAGTTA